MLIHVEKLHAIVKRLLSRGFCYCCQSGHMVIAVETITCTCV